jgi:hypothetical protein
MYFSMVRLVSKSMMLTVMSNKIPNRKITYTQELMADGLPSDASSIIMFGIKYGNGKLYRMCEQNNVTFFYVDHAYFNRAKAFHGDVCMRISKNRHVAGPIVPRPSDRFDSFGLSVDAWRGGQGDVVLILPPSDYIKDFCGCNTWLVDTVAILESLNLGKEIVIRHKGADGPTLADQLRNCYAMVTFNSSAAVEATLRGVPVVCTDMCCCAPISFDYKDLSDSSTMSVEPNRSGLLNHLAYSQFTLKEFYNGSAWKILLDE